MLTSHAGAHFTTSIQRYQDAVGTESSDRKIWIAIHNPSESADELPVMVDTGATWSVIGPDAWAALDLVAHVPLAKIRMNSRLGTFDVELHRAQIGIRADRGPAVVIDATLGLGRAWPGPPVVGYVGFLERLRFAVDPDTSEFHFAALP